MVCASTLLSKALHALGLPAVVIGETGLVIVAMAENAGMEPLAASPCGLARPKSRILACPREVTKMFPGFRSR